MKRFILVTSWYWATTLSLTLGLFLLYSNSRVKEGKVLITHHTQESIIKNGYRFYGSLPEVLGSFTQAVEIRDARPEILRKFLTIHVSPMIAYADYLITAADKYHIDYRLMTSIAMCESNLGKKMPDGSHNAWGYKIYTGQNSGESFVNWETAISTMAEYLATKYYAKGLVNPLDIGPIYAPPSVETGNSWANCVQRFMNELV